MVQHGGECSICNDVPGRLTRVELPDETVTLPMCDECYTDFDRNAPVDVTRVEE